MARKKKASDIGKLVRSGFRPKKAAAIADRKAKKALKNKPPPRGHIGRISGLLLPRLDIKGDGST